MGLIAYVFPGQGAQRAGMGKDLAANFLAARRVFEEADDALGFKISELCFDGDADELALTANAQPALLTASIAVLRVVQEEVGLNPDVVAGHSLGEYSALVCAQAMRFEDAVRIVRKRGQFMQDAVPAGQGRMAAVIGLDRAELQAICDEVARGDVVCPANFNGSGQVVIAGDVDAVTRAVELAKQKGAVVRPLKVSAPFHCPLMKTAATRLAEELRGVAFSDPAIPVMANTTASPLRSASDVPVVLTEQVVAPVQWEQIVTNMVRMGVGEFFELGIGDTLTSLISRIDERFKKGAVGRIRARTRRPQASAVQTPADIQDLSRRGFHDIAKHIGPLGFWVPDEGGNKISKDGTRVVWADDRAESVDEERWLLNENGTKFRRYGRMCAVWPDGRMEVLADAEWTPRVDGAFVKNDRSRIISPVGDVEEFDLADWDVLEDGTMRKLDGTRVIWPDGLEWSLLDHGKSETVDFGRP